MAIEVAVLQLLTEDALPVIEVIGRARRARLERDADTLSILEANRYLQQLFSPLERASFEHPQRSKDRVLAGLEVFELPVELASH